MRFFRGIAVPAAVADDVMLSIRQSGLNGDRGQTMLWERLDNPDQLFQKKDLSIDDTRGPRDAAPVGLCFCGDESSANIYACKRNFHREDDTPLLIEIEADLGSVAVDGRDFLYPVFQFGNPEKAIVTLEQLFGSEILRYAEAAWDSPDHRKRIALCDLAIHDNKVVTHHYGNRLVIGGRHSTLFRNAFKVRLPIESSAIVRVWRATPSSEFTASDIELADMLRRT
jgi:hypothetical protein